MAQGSEKSLSEVRGSHFLDLKEEGAEVDLGSPRVLPDSGTHEPSPEIQEGNTWREEGSLQAPPKARGDRPTARCTQKAVNVRCAFILLKRR